jgi:hypothetical protein
MKTGSCRYCLQRKPLRYAFRWCSQRCAAQEAVYTARRQRPWWHRLLGRA